MRSLFGVTIQTLCEIRDRPQHRPRSVENRAYFAAKLWHPARPQAAIAPSVKQSGRRSSSTCSSSVDAAATATTPHQLNQAQGPPLSGPEPAPCAACSAAVADDHGNMYAAETT